MTDTVGSLSGEQDTSPNDFRDANLVIIESIPIGIAGMSSRLIDQPNATKIRIQLAEALGLEDAELSARLAHFRRTGKVSS